MTDMDKHGMKTCMCIGISVMLVYQYVYMWALQNTCHATHLHKHQNMLYVQVVPKDLQCHTRALDINMAVSVLFRSQQAGTVGRGGSAQTVLPRVADDDPHSSYGVVHRNTS